MDNNFEIDNSVNIITNDNNNSYIALRRVKWFDNDYKLELRKWQSTPQGEIPGKGITFSGEEDVNELVESLVANGYGDTVELEKLLSERTGSSSNLKKPMIEKKDDDFYDPRDIFGEVY